METKQIAKALLLAQQEMGTAKKDSSNPFFKSKYADLNSIREACMPALNKYGIVVLQPTVHIDGKNFIKTVLLHESGESFEGLTEIVYSKVNDAQAQGSGITYARRYGLQSLVNVGADDDDGNKASQPQTKSDIQVEKALKATKPAIQTRPYLNENSEAFIKAQKYIADGGSIEEIEKKYSLSPTVKNLLMPEYK